MQSSLIGKIEKARRYAQEPDRVTFTTFSVKFRGENSEYETSYTDGAWHCTCSFFAGSHQFCTHTMAVERILSTMLPEEARTSQYDVASVSGEK
jgi:hypothetical protein